MEKRMRKNRMLELLWEAARGGKSPDWFEGKLPEHQDEYRADATQQLLRIGLLLTLA